MKNCIIAQSGGPTAAINATLAGVIAGALKAPEIDKVYGSVNGVKLDESNFSEYIYGGHQSKEVHLKDNAYFNYVP